MLGNDVLIKNKTTINLIKSINVILNINRFYVHRETKKKSDIFFEPINKLLNKIKEKNICAYFTLNISILFPIHSPLLAKCSTLARGL